MNWPVRMELALAFVPYGSPSAHKWRWFINAVLRNTQWSDDSSQFTIGVRFFGIELIARQFDV